MIGHTLRRYNKELGEEQQMGTLNKVYQLALVKESL